MIRFLICFFALAAAAAAERPNIIVLFADDAGYADFGFQEKPDPAMAKLTPHIDSLAASGLRFTDAYVSGAVCSPSRAGMLTGRYQQRFGHELNIPPGYMDGGMSLEERTIADRLRAAGYATGLIGKWHLGYPEPYQPNKRGFDYFYGLLQGSRSYFPYDKPHAHRVLQENGEPTPETGYVTDRIGEGAVRFIRDHKAKPFFLYVAFTSPHGPLQAKPEDLEACAGIADKKRRTYAAMVKAMDDNIGRILKALDDAGIAENTLVVFTNDNGGQTLTGAVNTPLQGRKGQLWEGGIRVPMCLRWPVAVKAPGRSVADPVITLDFLPTFLAAAGAEVDPAWKLDGSSLLPVIKGEAEALPPRTIYWRNQGSGGPVAARRGQWKLVSQGDPKGARTLRLYDLTADIGEANDLAAEQPEVAKSLAAEIAAWEGELIEPLWGAGAGKAKPDAGSKPKKRKKAE